MVYVRSYIIALLEISKLAGLAFLLGSFFYGYFWAIPFVYMSIMVAFGGPVGLLIKNK